MVFRRYVFQERDLSFDCSSSVHCFSITFFKSPNLRILNDFSAEAVDNDIVNKA